MELSGKTKIDDLLGRYPFLMDFFISRSAKFKMLQSTVMRKTVAKVATLSHVAHIGGIDLDIFLSEIAAEIKAKTGKELTVSAETTESVPIQDAGMRQEILKDIIRDLHKGVDMKVLKQRFYELIKDIDATEIAKMEQKLIEEGMPETEIKRLCDVHVEVFKEALGEQEVPSPPPGHPLHTFMKENRVAEDLAKHIKDVLEKLCDTPDKEIFRKHKKDLLALIDRLSTINLHYLRKENQLFPVLERHGISGPSEVMWAIHDDIRQTMKYAGTQVAELQVPLVYGTINYLLQSIFDMIYKEEHILFPMAMELLTDADWVRVRTGEEEMGYAWVEPEKGWTPKWEARPPEEVRGAEKLALSTGHLTPEQINLLLTHLPLDLSFVNEDDEVAYYSQTKERIFPRSPGVIGRRVQKCHPPKSLHIVQRIIDEFRAGKRDVAGFWIQMKGRFIHIRYFAVRDSHGRFKGTLEVAQDVSEIRKLEGEQRILDWD